MIDQTAQDQRMSDEFAQKAMAGIAGMCGVLLLLFVYWLSLVVCTSNRVHRSNRAKERAENGKPVPQMANRRRTACQSRAVVAIPVLFAAVLYVLFFVVPPFVDSKLNAVLVAVADLPPVSPRAAALHKTLTVVDMHADSLMWTHRDLNERHDYGHVDVPRLLEGNVAVQAFTIVSKVPRNQNYEKNTGDTDSITVAALVQRWPANTIFWGEKLLNRALMQARSLKAAAAASDGKLTVLLSRQQAKEYFEKRKAADAAPMTAGFLGVEGMHCLMGKVDNVRVLFEAGVRMMAPAHFFDNDVGGSAHGVKRGGLTRKGKKMIAEMEAYGMIVDLAHSSEKLLDDVLRVATRPVISSHTGVRGTCPGRRNLSDKHIKAIAELGGFISIAFFPQAVCGDTIGDVVKAIRYTADLVGVKHVALGSDYDGTVKVPFDAAHLSVLTSALLDDGFSEEDVALIMGANAEYHLTKADGLLPSM
jgi:microsomal dipeptidase-like Zn-dependent dipeptidase